MTEIKASAKKLKTALLTLDRLGANQILQELAAREELSPS